MQKSKWVKHFPNFRGENKKIFELPPSSYPLVNYHSNGISPFLIGNTSSKGAFLIGNHHPVMETTILQTNAHTVSRITAQQRSDRSDMDHIARKPGDPPKTPRVSPLSYKANPPTFAIVMLTSKNDDGFQHVVLGCFKVYYC